MSDLLPVIFSRGQNEGIDPRVAPPDVHRTAQNVRWRKDGRPAKRYGLTALTTAGLNAGFGYMTQAVNAIGSWNGAPMLALGSGVRTLTLALGWTAATGELSHWGPGERDALARDERAQLQNVTSGVCGGYVVHVWDDGTQLYYILRRTDGVIVRGSRVLATGTYARIVSTTNFLYILSKGAAGVINLVVFDPLTVSISGLSSPGTLASGACNFDACGRGANDWALAYQSAAGVVTVKLLSALAVPVVLQTQTGAIAAGLGAQVGIVSDSTNNVFVAALDLAHQLTGFAWNNALTALTGLAIIETDANNTSQPGLALLGAGSCMVVWGGFIAANETGYLRTVTIDASVAMTTTLGTYYGVNTASKPFVGPAYPTFPGDGPYVWAHTHNSLTEVGGNTKWDTQRTYYLMQLPLNSLGGGALRRQLHTPNIVASYPATGSHLSDVVSLGVGNGYLVPLPNAIRFGNGLAPAYGMDSITFHSIFESSRYAARDTAAAGRALQFTGGSLFELNEFAEETGFSSFPVIESIVGGAGGAMTTGANYFYRAVFEYIDPQGRRHRSASSDPFPYSSGANTAAVLTVKPLIADSHFAGGVLASGIVSLHIYRTLAGQGSYHRVTPNFGSPIGSSPPSGFAIAYSDKMSDAVLAGQEFIYTDGGVADNTLAPPSTFACVCNGRVWLGGQLERCVVTASKLLVEGEPTQFSDLDVFSVFLPQKCTGLASLDGTVVAFAREAIYLIQGDGPDDQGKGEFSPPGQLPTDVGCIDWRSIVETSLGIFFQAKRGIYLLPRGFNTPLFIGAEIEDTLALYPVILSGTLVSVPSTGTGKLGEITVRFVLAADETSPGAAVITFDTRTQGWSVDLINGGNLGPGGSWSDTFIIAQVTPGTGALAGLNAESSSGYSDGGGFIRTALGTGDIRPFGVGGYGQFEKVLVMGEYRGNAQVQIQVSVDGATADTFTYTVTSADAADGVVYLDATPRAQKGASIRVTVTDFPDPGTGSAATEGFIAQALFLETELIGKTKRLPTGRKA